MRNIVGKRVREARHSFRPKMTQAQLAAKLSVEGWDIDRGGVAKIEAGIRQVTDIELKRLSESLGVTISWLMGESKR